MFSWSISNDAYRFSSVEDKFIRKLLDICVRACPKTCAFIHLVDMSSVEFWWAPNMVDEGVFGAWDMLKPNKIYLSEMCKQVQTTIVTKHSGYYTDIHTAVDMDFFMTPDMVITLIHELIHKFQFKVAPIAYVVNRLITLFCEKIPYLQKITIEYDAHTNSETTEMVEFAHSFCACYNTFHASVLQKLPTDSTNWMHQNWCGYHYENDILVENEQSSVYPKFLRDQVLELVETLN